MQINVGSADLKVVSFKLDSGSLAPSVIAFSMTLRRLFLLQVTNIDAINFNTKSAVKIIIQAFLHRQICMI